MKPTKEERKAREIATRLVNVLAEIQLFFGDADIIFKGASEMHPTKFQVSEMQLKEIKNNIAQLEGEETLTI